MLRYYHPQFTTDNGNLEICAVSFSEKADFDRFVKFNEVYKVEEVPDNLYMWICRALDTRDKKMNWHTNEYHELGRRLVRAQSRDEVFDLMIKAGL